MATFLTGATGFIGRYLAAAMIEDGEELVLLVRGRNARDGFERLHRAIVFSGDVDPLDVASRATICVGDLESPGLGLRPDDRERIIATCNRFLHCGASVRFDLPLEKARAINLGGTAKVLDLARERQRRYQLERVDIVSTAYVAGLRTDLVSETELDGSAGHKNTYERSKFEAERLFWSARAELPISVFRPSAVVGESRTGRTPSFLTIYLPIKMYARGIWRTLPGNPDSKIDLVPVDFVRDAILGIRRSPDSVGRCFHLAAGPDGEATLGDLAGIVERFFPNRKPIRFADPLRWRRYALPLLGLIGFGRFAQVANAARALLPYGIANPSFDNANTRTALAGSGIALPHVTTYIERLLAYGVETDWGRKTHSLNNDHRARQNFSEFEAASSCSPATPPC